MASKKIAIIGAGFTGLSAAYSLSKQGYQVTVFEKDSQPGGLAIGFSDAKWDWSLEKHYHHLFTSDWAIRNLASEVGHPINFSIPITSTLIDGTISQLDSPQSLLNFSGLSFFDRLRTAFGLALLKFNPYWQPFEHITAYEYIRLTMGEHVWKVLWEPLFMGKFGVYTPTISASWFWARIYKRSGSLGYPEGGFQSLANSIEKAASKLGVKFIYNSSVNDLKYLLKKYDKVICTLPTPLFSKLSGLDYPKLSGIGAVNLVLSLKRDFLPGNTYWLNINDRSMPFLAVVEHTHFQNADHYNGDHLIYIGNYLPPSHEYFKLSAYELLKIFIPHLKKINPKFNASWVIASWIWTAPFAQPIVQKNYSKLLPSIVTPIKNLYLANIQQVYPWDRGTNYAVELGGRVADLCVQSAKEF